MYSEGVRRDEVLMPGGAKPFRRIGSMAELHDASRNRRRSI